jgi:hypothetical protein
MATLNPTAHDQFSSLEKLKKSRLGEAVAENERPMSKEWGREPCSDERACPDKPPNKAVTKKENVFC